MCVAGAASEVWGQGWGKGVCGKGGGRREGRGKGKEGKRCVTVMGATVLEQLERRLGGKEGGKAGERWGKPSSCSLLPLHYTSSFPPASFQLPTSSPPASLRCLHPLCCPLVADWPCEEGAEGIRRSVIGGDQEDRHNGAPGRCGKVWA